MDKEIYVNLLWNKNWPQYKNAIKLGKEKNMKKFTYQDYLKYTREEHTYAKLEEENTEYNY